MEKEGSKDLGQEVKFREKVLPWLVSSVADTDKARHLPCLQPKEGWT